MATVPPTTPVIALSVKMYTRPHQLPEQLVRAMVHVESSGDEFAWNPEPKYRYLWDVRANKPFRALSTIEVASEMPPADFPTDAGDRDAEWWGQQASWGPLQVMGAVAREHGFKGHFPRLCSTALGIDIGCKHLARLRDRFLRSHGWAGVVAAYNAGSPRMAGGGGFVNQAYVDKVARAGGFDGLEGA